MDVGIHQAEHLRLLESAHAVQRAGHENAHPLFAAHRIFRRAAGVATGRTQNIQIFAAACQFVLKQIP